MTSFSTTLPPSPTDLSSPSARKRSNLQIDINDSPNDITTGSGFWKSQSNLFSPPLSPLTPFSTERPTQSNTSRKKTQQQQQQQPQAQAQQQLVPVPWQTNWKDIDIETLTLENAKLQRANRLLKVDREDWLEKRLKPLDQHIRELTVTNVRWQRAAKLLQQDVEEAQQQLADWKHYQMTRIPQMDPEYQFLVNMIYHLQSQINGRTTCKETNGIMTKPRFIDHAYSQNISEDGSKKASHSTCSTATNQEMTWDELSVLVDKIHLLEQNLETTLQQLSQKNHVVERLESEVQKKDQLMARLEKDFDEMNDKLQSWQHVIENGLKPSASDARAPLDDTTTTEMELVIEGGLKTTSSISSSLGSAVFALHDSDDMNNSNHGDIFELDENSESDQSLLTDNAESPNDDEYQYDDFDKLTCDLPTTAKAAFVSPSLACHLKTGNANAASAAVTHRRASSSVYSSSSTTTIACCEDDEKHHQRCITYSASSSQNSTNGSSSSSPAPTSPISEQQTIPSKHSPYPLATARFAHQFPSIFTMNSNSTISLPGSYPHPITSTASDLSVSSTSTTISSELSSIETKNIQWSGSDSNNDDDGYQGRAAVLRTLVMGHEPYAPFALMSLFLGLSTKMGINEDWLIPITLLALFSGYLWRGAFCGIRIKVNI